MSQIGLSSNFTNIGTTAIGIGGGINGSSIYVCQQGSGGSSYLNPTITNISAKRGPYKKDKFKVGIKHVNSQTGFGMKVIDTVGKIKTLAQIGQMLDNMKPNESFELSITKIP